MKNFALVCFSVLFTIICVEGGARLLIKLKYGYSTYGRHHQFEYNPYVIHSSVKDKVKNRINKTSDDFLVLVVGGSTAKRLPDEMIKSTFESLTTKNIHVINLGSGGFITNQEIAALAVYGMRLKPDLLLALNGANDIVSFTKTNQPGKSFYEDIVKNAVKSPLANLGLSVVRSSQFFNSIGKLKERTFETAVIAENNVRPLLDHYAENIQSLATIAHGMNIPFIYMLQPHIRLKQNLTTEEKQLSIIKKYEYRKEFFQDIYPILWEQINRERLVGNVLKINANTLFNHTELTCFEDEVHLTKQGNQVLLDGLNAIIITEQFNRFF